MEHKHKKAAKKVATKAHAPVHHKKVEEVSPKPEEVSVKSPAALREEHVLEFWEREKVFEKSLKQNEGNEEFIFYEGPPTANAAPALHHLEARAFKDVIPRYKTMQGRYVRRRAGWDTHGLPVELQIEKKLGFTSKKDIETYGIAKYNKECRDSVFEYIGDWEKFTDRIGYWVDKKSAYYTFDPNYIESLWNILAHTEKRGLLYKDYKVIPWCARCGTGLSSHELAQGYKDVKDLSVTVKFKIIGFPDAYFLAWTTTPWTLPGNVALAVGEEIEYVEAKVGNEILVLAKDRLSVLTDPHEIVATHKGKEMIGMEYEPLYPFMKENFKGEGMDKAYKVYSAGFVTTEDGTGIVHTAVMYGADDFELGSSIGLPKYHLVKEDGTFKEETGFLGGKFVKDEATDVEVIKDLAHRGLLYKKEKYEHSYPHCWRCQTPLIYYARDSWYIRMSALRAELMAENEKVNWEPSHTKEGRFGEWIREVKDWAISRERYWGTPLPIWTNTTGERIVVDSYETLKKYSKTSTNAYFVMRHGETEDNGKGLIADDMGSGSLDSAGVIQAEHGVKKLKEEKIDLIFSSPFLRTKKTAELVAHGLGIDPNQIIFDDRLKEMHLGEEYKGKTWQSYHEAFPKTTEYFTKAPKGGESYFDVRKRMLSFLFEIEEKYKGKRILIVTHGGPAWILICGASWMDAEGILSEIRDKKGYHYLENAEVREMNFTPFPHNQDFEFDPHRPFIDGVVLEKDGTEFRRVKEVMDVWFDSGSMPFAQEHWPFGQLKVESLKLKGNMEFQPKKGLLHAQHGYPADFISEAIDQTRGWFYTLLAVGTLMECGTPYKNVICLGHLLDSKGAKMSKSVGNIIDPWKMIEKYGADTLRLWMYSVNQPGDSKNFDEKTVAETNNKIFNLLYNVLAFYELYKTADIQTGTTTSENILDQWILVRLNQLIELVSKNLDTYKLMEPVRAMRDFIDDLSTWYLRRSRERIKSGDINAKQTLYIVLKTMAKLLAPFAPFTAEDLWLKLKNANDKESVHLAKWPAAGAIDETITANMQIVRDVASAGLKERQKAVVPVRQPLGKLKVKSLKLQAEYTELIKDELNVKEVLEDVSIPSDAELDVTITPELKQEGDFRELVRAVQDLRKAKGLEPSTVILLTLSSEYKDLIASFGEELKKVVSAKDVTFMDGEEKIKIE